MHAPFSRNPEFFHCLIYSPLPTGHTDLLTPPNRMEFGSAHLLAGPSLDDSEDIYIDDVQDGIASMAAEQAAAWVAEYKELELQAGNGGSGGGGERAAFLKQLIDLCRRQMRSKAGAKRGGAQHGPMGSRTRLQPAHGANAARYQALSRAGVARDLALAQQAKADSAELQLALAVLRRDVGLADGGADMDKTAAEAIMHTFRGGLGSLEQANAAGNDDPKEDPDDVVFAIGSYMCSAGFAGEEYPRSVFPSLVGRAKHPGVMVGMDQKDSYVGDEAQTKRGVLTLKHAIERGSITNWDDFEKIVGHTLYNELRVDPSEQGVVIVAPPTTEAQFAKLLQILFESFSVPQVALANPFFAASVASGRAHAIVVDLGYAEARVTCVVNGGIVDGTLVRIPLGGRDLDDYLMRIMTERGYSFTTTSERDLVRDIKEKMSVAVPDCAAAVHDIDSFGKTYELPDGQVIQLDSERFRIVEPWFCPAIVGKDECLSLQDAITVSLSRVCPASIRRHLAQNILLSGGASLVKGLQARLAAELKRLFGGFSKELAAAVDVMGPPDRKHSAWSGASILSSLESFKAVAPISKEDFDHYGPAECARYATAQYFTQPPLKAIVAGGDDIPPAPTPAMVSASMEPTDKSDTANTKNGDANPGESKVATKTPAKEEKEDKTTVAMTKAQANANKLLVSASDLVSAPIINVCTLFSAVQCAHCPAFFTSQQTFTKFTASESWCCALCGKEQPKGSAPPSVPTAAPTNTTAQAIEYALTPSVSASSLSECKTASVPQQQRRQGRLVVFCVDTSGSMGVTAAIPGGLSLYTGWKEKKTVNHVSRLLFVQNAVRAKILQLARDEPSAVPVLVTFGSSVSVSLPDGTEQKTSARSVLSDTNALLAVGGAILDRFCTKAEKGGMRSSMRTLLRQLHASEVSGCTALGPALAVAVGMCSKRVGSQVIVCTDGVANVGVGSLDSKTGKEPTGTFYNAVMPMAAKASGTSISILTLDGCEAGVDTLGTVADMTSGRVNVIDPQDLKGSFASDIVVATDVSVTVLAGAGTYVQVSGGSDSNCGGDSTKWSKVDLGNCVAGHSQVSFELSLPTDGDREALDDAEEAMADGDGDDDDFPDAFMCPISLCLMQDPVIMSDGYSYERQEAENWLVKQKQTTSPLTNEELASTELIANTTLRHSIEAALAEKRQQQKQLQHQPTSSVTVQVQVSFVDTSKKHRVRIFTKDVPVSFSRRRAEATVSARAVAVQAIHEAAAKASRHEYEAARIKMISTQRLLQRTMRADNMRDYMAFIAYAEVLDNFMREAKVQAKFLASSVASSCAKSENRDDNAAAGIFKMKALTLDEFSERARQI